MKIDFIKKALRNAKARERYFKLRYGDLKRMHAIDQKLESEIDEACAIEEIEKYENSKKK